MPAPQSPVLEETKQNQEAVKAPEYSDAETQYLGGLAVRLESARSQREQKHPLLDGMTYTEYWWSNERGANTLTDAKKTKDEIQFASGTSRNKLFAMLAPVAGQDLSPDIQACDENQMELQGAGQVMEDVDYKTRELDSDDEKKNLRQYELAKQGDVFIEELYEEQWGKDKKTGKAFDGTVTGFTVETKPKRLFARPTRRILSNLSVYLGSLRIYDVKDQPYVFTVNEIDGSDAESKYGKWERWANVPHDLATWASTAQEGSLMWACARLTPTITKDRFQEVRYQDKLGNEYALILNGVLMTPVGLPLPWGWPDYNIVQQGLEPLSAHFAIHGSIIRRLSKTVGLLDELTAWLLLKTKLSAKPPLLNLSGRVVSSRVTMPNAITSGLQTGDLVPIHNKLVEGPTAGEFNMMESIRASTDRQSVNDVAAGQQPSGSPTATQILEVQHQAKLLANLTEAACTFLEWKLAWLRLFNNLQHWFKETGDRYDKVKDEIVGKHRITNVERQVPGKGMGRRVTVPMKGPLPSPEAIDTEEKRLQKETGTPYKLVFVSPDRIEDAALVWTITVRPKEKRSSERSKIMFDTMLTGVERLVKLGSVPNNQDLNERFATAWDADPTKLFERPGMTPQQPAPAAPAAAAGITPPAPVHGPSPAGGPLAA